eukprot:TRINITY_DN8624_c0_g1_i4.p1 TRINITY_DN8624_c0_g1~~TRINITY_DN8624_c0_g1_i4.p1  ORF type:complete len:436 (+),score=49.72 TRINITY_DN8624_c0_g1_i4:160-1308(+)
MLKLKLKEDVNSVDHLEELSLGKLLILPQAFGSIYLGETFYSYICIHNDSTESCRKITLKADLQTSTQRISLVSGQDELKLAPGETIDHVIQHEVKELGSHILVCDVTYSSQSAEKLNFRKFFKFQVMKPLDVKTKFYNADKDEVYLEAQVQNITQGIITLDKVLLEPSNIFTVKTLSVEDENEDSESGIFSNCTALQPQDSWQYLFCLSPKTGLSNDKLVKTITSIGKLDIVWRTPFGDKGRLQTSQLQRQPPVSGELSVSVISAPSLAQIHKPFPLMLKVTNNSERTVELQLNLENKAYTNFMFTGVVNNLLGLLEPGGVSKIKVDVIPESIGLQYISGITIRDLLLGRDYVFTDLVQVLTLSDQDLINVIDLTTEKTGA